MYVNNESFDSFALVRPLECNNKYSDKDACWYFIPT